MKWLIVVLLCIGLGGLLVATALGALRIRRIVRDTGTWRFPKRGLSSLLTSDPPPPTKSRSGDEPDSVQDDIARDQ
jgi:hypothetical protein